MRPGPVLRHRSPVHGLDRRRLGPFEVLAQSVSSAAPAAAMAAAPVIASSTAGTGTLWSFALATVLALLIGAGVGQFTRRMAVAGSLYSLTAQGLGPFGAFACGVALLVGYGGLAAGALTGGAIYVDGLLTRLGVPTSELVAVLGVLGLAAAAGVLARVRLSARFVLLAESVSITLMVVVFALLWRAAPTPAPMPDPGPGGVAAGVG